LSGAPLQVSISTGNRRSLSNNREASFSVGSCCSWGPGSFPVGLPKAAGSEGNRLSISTDWPSRQVVNSDEVIKPTVGHTDGLLICVGWQCRQVAHFYRLAIVTGHPMRLIEHLDKLHTLAICPNRQAVEGARLLVVAGCSKRQIADSDGLSIWAGCPS
jgi:hypothetical protein